MLRNLIFCIASLLFLGACAQTNPHPDDPFERLNRITFSVNETVDTAVFKPAAYIYLKYIPLPVQLGVGNFFDNLREIATIANDILQGKFAYASHDLSRFLINSTLGIGGIFDPASSLGLEHRVEDLGQTLYKWGYRKSNYIILPFLGPSTVRDTLGFAVDYYAFSVFNYIKPKHIAVELLALDYFDRRSRILRKGSILDTLAVDKYVFMRDAYFQNRQYSFNETSENELAADPYAENN